MTLCIHLLEVERNYKMVKFRYVAVYDYRFTAGRLKYYKYVTLQKGAPEITYFLLKN